MKDEAAVVEDIKRAFGALVAPGAYDLVDDAAMIPPVLHRRARVITTDVVVEGVDFDRALYPVAFAGFRALAQNVSDLAAMGAFPVGFVWSLAIPSEWLRGDDVRELARGAAILAKLRTVPLFGGDLSSTSGPLVCSITAFGDVDGLPVRRSGAKPGDDVYLSRLIGGSAAGLRLVRAQPHGDYASFDAWLRALPPDDANNVRAHVGPLPEDGRIVAGIASACIDVSDGLAKDAARLARASAVRLDLDDVARAVALGATLDDALHGGEDYALLFTAAPGRGGDAVRIGRVVEGDGVFVGGAPLAPRGYDHFAH